MSRWPTAGGLSRCGWPSDHELVPIVMPLRVLSMSKSGPVLTITLPSVACSVAPPRRGAQPLTSCVQDFQARHMHSSKARLLAKFEAPRADGHCCQVLPASVHARQSESAEVS
jgi:hypothetical protein